MTHRVPCRTCGELILSGTAAKNDGCCVPCRRGYRSQIEAGKRRREEERKYDQSAERKYWLSLVSRVHDTPNGLSSLSDVEKSYFAVSCLIGEVYNGGFHQFFFNSSGGMYGVALDGLFELDAHETAGLLAKAKHAIFADALVPTDIRQRREKLRSMESTALLDSLDQQFYASQENLPERCRQFALTHGLHKDG